MAKEQTQSGSLADFQFTNDDEFFGQKLDKIDTETENLKEIKSPNGASSTKVTDIKDAKKVQGSTIDDEEIEDEEEPTFFGEEIEEEKPKEPKKKKAELVEEDEEEVVEGKKKPETTKKKVEENTEDTEDTEDTEEETEEEKDKAFFGTLAKELKEKGVFANIELKDDEVVDEEKFFELQEKEVDARVDEVITGFMEELDEDGKAFLKFKKDGGKTSDFIAHISNQFDLEELDDTNTKDVQKVLRHYITQYEGTTDAEEIEERMSYIKDSGKEKAFANKWFKTIKDDQEEEKENLLKQAKEFADKRKEKAKEFATSIQTELEKLDTVNDIPFTPKDKKELNPYITKPTVKVGNNRYIPGLNAELSTILRAETPEARKHLLLLAKLVKTKFDFSDLKRSTKTKVVKEANSELRKIRETGRPNNSGNKDKSRSLSDFF